MNIHLQPHSYSRSGVPRRATRFYAFPKRGAILLHEYLKNSFKAGWWSRRGDGSWLDWDGGDSKIENKLPGENGGSVFIS
ncbi:hypothetical protein [Burkholderia plantarii]|uniref:hypothetical protein n=1 Tax=Burkholderia plantarii TaxID=41899 RepID=UPI0013923EAB|nr:hypothetical protein [Burkholderia plantarii]